MASVWYQCDCHKGELKIAGYLSIGEACDELRAQTAKFCKQTGGTAWGRSKLEALLFNRGGKLHGLLYVEPCSPPSSGEEWDNRRPRKRKA